MVLCLCSLISGTMQSLWLLYLINNGQCHGGGRHTTTEASIHKCQVDLHGLSSNTNIFAIVNIRFFDSSFGILNIYYALSMESSMCNYLCLSSDDFALMCFMSLLLSLCISSILMCSIGWQMMWCWTPNLHTFTELQLLSHAIHPWII